MSVSDLERQLAEALRRGADDVIAEADTPARHDDLMRELRRQPVRHARPRQGSRGYDTARSGRRTWAAVVAAAAAAAAVISLPALLPAQTSDGEGPARAPEPSAVRVARDFVDAIASYDRERAASYLADDAEVHLWETRTGEEAWRGGNRWLEAIGMQVILLSCQQTGTSAVGTLVECAFDWHALHSEQLGYGPFVGGLFMFTVDGGEIVFVRQVASSEDLQAQLWEPFARWVARTHPEDAAQMYADWPDQSWESLTPRSIELWKSLTREWASRQGG